MDASAAETWSRRLAHLQNEEAVAADPAQKFALAEQIREAKAKIAELETSAGVKAKGSVRDDPDWTSLFMAPEFQDAANRASLHEELARLVRSSPVCVVGGLSGNGKTVLVASCLRKLKPAGIHADVLWHEPSEGEALDSLLVKLDPRAQVPGLTATEKAKQCVANLVNQRKLLVIDDFHQVDRTGYQPLVAAAARTVSPARLVLISQVHLGMQDSIPAIPHLVVPGLTIEELEAFLEFKGGIRLPQHELEDLHRKIDGLPFAVEFFVVLVTLGTSPANLLKGDMLGRERVRTWFQQVERWGRKEQSTLLRLLSLCDGPFNMGVVQLLCRYASISNGEDVFEGLQRRYLVQQCSPYRWKLHHLVRTLCGTGWSEPERRQAHFVLGQYFLKTARRIARRYTPEQSFLWRVRASEHLQRAGNYAAATENLCALAKHVKFNGYYEFFIRMALAIPEIERVQNKWLSYHLAHCYLITGRLKASLRIAESLTYDSDLELDLRISFVRLYAEVQEALGNPHEGLARVRELNTAITNSKAPRNLVSHLGTVEVRLLTATGDYATAEQRCQEQLAECVRNKDERGRAVALTGWGIVCEATGRFAMAAEKLKEGANVFNRIPDNRGFSWSLSHLAFCMYQCLESVEAEEMLCTALKLKSDIHEASLEYEQFLVKVASCFRSPGCLRLVSFELARVRARMADLQRSEWEQ